MSAPISFGFKRTFKSLPTIERKAEEATAKVFISEFGEDGLSQISKEEHVIPKLPNSFRLGSHSQFTPTFVPAVITTTDQLKSEDRFEAEKKTEIKELPSYGLQPRNATVDEPMESEFVSENQPSTDKDNLEAFRAEVNALPDEANFEAYARMPVEAFGLAMLKGMDWKEGHVVGKNKNKKPVDAVEFVPRASRLGLGAAPNSLTSTKKDDKQPAMVLPSGPDGKVRHVRTLDEKLVPYEEANTVKKGSKRKIVSGEHEGLDCVVVQSAADDTGDVLVKLPNQEHVRVACKDLVDAYSCSDHDYAAPTAKKRKASRETEIKSDSWLQSGIRVRVVDKRLDKGRFYLKKGVVVDITSPGVADLVMDESQSLKENVKESSLETVVPRKEGATVLIVRGALKGNKAKLLQRTRDTGIAAVQLHSDLTVHQMPFDDIAEYTRS